VSATIRHVTITKASELTGYTEDAIRAKIKRGEWLEGRVWIKAPDGRNLIDMEGYELWATGAASLQHRKAA
jgi:hypothetical protein